MFDLLNAAFAQHHAGQLEAAAKLYQQVLASQSDHPDALHLLGVVEHQRGRHASAVDLIAKAVALRPNVPAFHANLAEAYRALGEFELAAGCCRTAILLAPDYAEAWSNLGLAEQSAGSRAAAIQHFRRALELKPDFAAAYNNLGIALTAEQQHAEAETSFRRALELEPQLASAQSNLGTLLLERGAAEEALPYLQEAVRLDPRNAQVRHNLGNALRQSQQLLPARAAYLEALRLAPDLAASQVQLGLMLQRDGDLAGALAWLARAAELEPDNADYWDYLADLHADREDFAAAAECWRRAILLSPQRADFHNSLGWALQEEGQLDAAGQEFRLALALRPEFGRAWVNLGGLQEELGNLPAAEESFRTALRVQPTFSLPHARLATLLRRKLPDEDLAALEGRLDDEALGSGPRARLLFGLAQALDARGEHARAAACLQQANALAFTVRRVKRPYSTVDHERFVDALIATFDRELFGRLAGCGADTRRPIFVFGLPRSGTTLVEQILASHSQVFGAGELRLARQTFESMPAVLRAEGPAWRCTPLLETASVAELARLHQAALAAVCPASADRVVDKMPDNYLYLGFLQILFPRAYFIYCRRDLRDVAVSCWMTDFRSIRWASEMESLVHRIRQHERLMAHWRVLKLPIIEVEYEALTRDFEVEAQRLVAACDLKWEPDCLTFHQTRRVVRTASVSQVREPIYQRSAGRWRNYARELPDLFAAISDLLSANSSRS